jgi:hypothetical protein
MFDFVMKMFSEGDAAIPALVWKKCQNNWLNQYQQIVFCFNTK